MQVGERYLWNTGSGVPQTIEVVSLAILQLPQEPGGELVRDNRVLVRVLLGPRAGMYAMAELGALSPIDA